MNTILKDKNYQKSTSSRTYSVAYSQSLPHKDVDEEYVADSDQSHLVIIHSYTDKPIQSNDFSKVVTLMAMAKASYSTGSYVKLREENSFLPTLIDNKGKPHPLYLLIETFDECIDYDEVLTNYPDLSYEHIDGAINFLRKLAQFNFKNIDLDELEDEYVASDEIILEELNSAMNDEETTNVRNDEKLNIRREVK